MVDAALENTAAVTVGADCDAITTNRIKDELGVFSLEMVQTFLNNVVAIQVLDKLDDLIGKGLDDDANLSEC